MHLLISSFNLENKSFSFSDNEKFFIGIYEVFITHQQYHFDRRKKFIQILPTVEIQETTKSWKTHNFVTFIPKINIVVGILARSNL